MEGTTDLGVLAARIERERHADVLLFRGAIGRDVDGQLAPARLQRADRTAVILVLSTMGGSGDAAYRVARALRRGYRHVTVIVDDACKGAGTLLAVSADELVMSDYGELGPLDLQGGAPAQLGQMSSGQAPLQALRSLRAETLDLFDETYRHLRERGRPPLSTRAAAERASEIAVGLVGPISAQIDPSQIGEVDRGVRMAALYARRIEHGNLKPGALDRLMNDYPSHDFVVDREEARDLFQRVRAPLPDEAELLTLVEPILADRRNQGRFLYLEDLGSALAAPDGGPSDEDSEAAADAPGEAGQSADDASVGPPPADATGDDR